jgi:hypothetical protein
MLDGYVPLEAADVARLGRHRLPIVDVPSAASRVPYLATRVGSSGRPVCVALEGEPGGACACTVYEDRPEACRRYEVGGALCRSARLLLGIGDAAG